MSRSAQLHYGWLVPVMVGALYVATVTWAWADTSPARAVAPFERVYISGTVRVEIESGGVAGYRVLLPRSVTAESVDGVLYVEGPAQPGGDVAPAPGVKVRSAGPLREIVVNGAAEVVARGIQGKDLILESGGAGSVALHEMRVKELTVVARDASRFVLSGVAQRQIVDVAGRGNYGARHLHTEFSEVRVFGAGRADVWARDYLHIDTEDRAAVRYTGTPFVEHAHRAVEGAPLHHGGRAQRVDLRVNPRAVEL